MRVPKPRVPGVDKVLFAVAGLALGAGALSWWENREPVEVEPEPDVVVGVTLFCRLGDLVVRDAVCDDLDGDEWHFWMDRYLEVRVRTPEGTVYTVDYAAVDDVSIGDEWPVKENHRTPYATGYLKPYE